MRTKHTGDSVVPSAADASIGILSERLVKQTATAESVTEMKFDDPMMWIGRMNSIRNRAMEIVNAEIIYR